MTQPLTWTIGDNNLAWLSAIALAPGLSVAWGNVIRSFTTGYNAAWHADNGSVKRAEFATLREGIDWCNLQYEDVTP